MQQRLLPITVAALLVVVSPAVSQNTQDAIPRFERADCDYPVPATIARDVRRECGYLVVPETRARPDGRKFRLAVVIYRAQEPSNAPPLLLLHGGPGGAGGTRFRGAAPCSSRSCAGGRRHFRHAASRVRAEVLS
jgi:acetyl esterase/lipase